ncbi:MAG TPA: hypothetical protein VNL36_03920 [Bacteroidota bacterium]|nr:hypothetical protein [Bacteroidota bacterium]
MYFFSKRDWILERLRHFSDQYSGWTNIAAAYLAGLFVNTMSDPGVRNIGEILGRIFDLHQRPMPAFLSWLALVVFFVFTAARTLLPIYFRKRSYELLLAKMYRDKVDDSVKQFQRGRIAWGSNLTLQTCPDLHNGWQFHELQFSHETDFHTLPEGIDSAYQDYLSHQFNQEFSFDATRLMLAENPVSFSDLPNLRLKVRRTTWSQIQFCNRLFKANQSHYTDQFLNGNIEIANTLVLHLVVASHDGFVLLTQTSAKAAYYPEKWACSIGEQLDPMDLADGETNVALKWAQRALLEELGVTSDAFNPTNLRFMAVYLEADSGNFAIPSVVRLNYDHSTLDAIIDKHPRTDYEFQNWLFVPWDDLPRELISPSRTYHPNTSMCMLYACLFKFGPLELNRRLVLLHKQ